MNRMRKILLGVASMLCITTSILVMLYLFHYISNVWVVFAMCVITFIVSGLNLLVIMKNRKR